MLMSYVLGGQD